MIVVDIQQQIIRCWIISGDQKFAGKIVFIPRITLEPLAENLSIPLCQRQFPICLAFSMTINKPQGQSVKNVGLDLRTSVFSHGQLYVALSQCTSGNRIKIILPDNNQDQKTSNIVYQEILKNLEL